MEFGERERGFQQGMEHIVREVLTLLKKHKVHGWYLVREEELDKEIRGLIENGFKSK